ncbi:MAG: DNA-processing protein DprA [Leptospirales bacterium]
MQSVEYQTILTYLTLYYKGVSYRKAVRDFSDAKNKIAILENAKKINTNFPDEAQRAFTYLKSHELHMGNILYLGHSEYPKELYRLQQPPLLLFLRGNRNLLTRKKVSLVGSRKPCLLSVALTRQIARHFSETGYVTVSGLAAGIDGVVHANSLEGGTIGVLGSGFDYVYPVEHEYFYRMAKGQSKNILIISEHPDDRIPKPYLFLKRNRIIAALGESLFFMNGGKKSGAISTVQEMQKLGKNIFYLNHKLQKNNEGIAQIRLLGIESKDATDDFPVTIKTKLSKDDLKQKPGYLGNSRWVIINRKSFSQLPFSPAQADLYFPE